MGSFLSRTVEIQICNNTKSITLKEPRTYFNRGYCSKCPRPELSPGSSDTCHFSGDPQLWGVVGTTWVAGILVYETQSFTLAIYCYNPTDHNKFCMELGLELSPGKAHLGNLWATYRRVANGTYSSSDQDIKFARILVGKSLETAWVSHGPVKVVAAISPGTSSTVKLVLEE